MNFIAGLFVFFVCMLFYFSTATAQIKAQKAEKKRSSKNDIRYNTCKQ